MTAMHPDTFEQVELPRSALGTAASFLAEGVRLNVLSFGSEVLTATLPEFVDVEVANSGPSMKVGAVREGLSATIRLSIMIDASFAHIARMSVLMASSSRPPR